MNLICSCLHLDNNKCPNLWSYTCTWTSLNVCGVVGNAKSQMQLLVWMKTKWRQQRNMGFLILLRMYCSVAVQIARLTIEVTSLRGKLLLCHFLQKLRREKWPNEAKLVMLSESTICSDPIELLLTRNHAGVNVLLLHKRLHTLQCYNGGQGRRHLWSNLYFSITGFKFQS